MNGFTCGYLERIVFPEKNKVIGVFVGSRVFILWVLLHGLRPKGCVGRGGVSQINGPTLNFSSQ